MAGESNLLVLLKYIYSPSKQDDSQLDKQISKPWFLSTNNDTLVIIKCSADDNCWESLT